MLALDARWPTRPFSSAGGSSVALATYSSTMRTASGSPARVPLASPFWGSIRLVSLSARSSLIPWVELLPIASIASASWWSQICSRPSFAWWPLHFFVTPVFVYALISANVLLSAASGFYLPAYHSVLPFLVRKSQISNADSHLELAAHKY